MTLRTRLTEQFAISCPVIQAPMAGGGDTPALVSAVSNAGALGFIGAAYLTPEQIIERGGAVRSTTSRPFGVNLFAPLPVAQLGTGAVKKAREQVLRYYDELGLPSPEWPADAPPRFNTQANDPANFPFGVACAGPELFPTRKLNLILRRIVRERPNHSARYDFGSESLRRQIARPSLALGCSFSPRDVTVTSGGLEAINVSLRGVPCQGGALTN